MFVYKSIDSHKRRIRGLGTKEFSNILVSFEIIFVCNKGAFSANSFLTSVTVPTSLTEIGVGMFSYCTNLTAIVIPTYSLFRFSLTKNAVQNFVILVDQLSLSTTVPFSHVVLQLLRSLLLLLISERFEFEISY